MYGVAGPAVLGAAAVLPGSLLWRCMYPALLKAVMMRTGAQRAAATAQVIVGGGWRNRILTPIVAALGVPVLHTWNQTVPLWQYNHHYNPNCGDRYDCGDCTHTCHPSMYEARACAWLGFVQGVPGL